MKYVSIDIETTGLDPDICQVLELGAVIEDWERPVAQLPVFRRVLIRKEICGEPVALAMNAGLLKLIAGRQDPPDSCLPAELGRQFAAWLTLHGVDPLHVQPAGKNFANFDAQFLKRLTRFNEHVHFKHRTLDPAMLFWNLSTDETLPDSKTCMERAGIDGEVAHTAVEDALSVVRMIRYAVSHK